MITVRTSEDPLTRALELPTGGTVETRAARHHADVLARQTSNEIDDWLKKHAAKRNDQQVRILLLGMLGVLSPFPSLTELPPVPRSGRKWSVLTCTYHPSFTQSFHLSNRKVNNPEE
jgi:hypothetical protein